MCACDAASLTAETALPATTIIDAIFPNPCCRLWSTPYTRSGALCRRDVSRKVDRLAAILSRLDGLVLNRAEATAYHRSDRSKAGPDVSMLASTLAGWIRHGGHVLVSDGGDSAALATGDQLATAMPPAIQMVNANGAGDAMAAALFRYAGIPPCALMKGYWQVAGNGAGGRCVPFLETRWTIIMISMRFSNETDAARQAGTPLVALESTLISHGLPHPDNIDVARGAEEAVRVLVPHPTMAVLDGVAHIGLDDAAITQLATQAGVKSFLGAICRWRFQGLKRRRRRATTVSATMILRDRRELACLQQGYRRGSS